MKNSATGERNTQVERGEEYNLLSSFGPSLNLDLNIGEISVIISKSHSFRNGNQNMMENAVLGVIQQGNKWKVYV